MNYYKNEPKDKKLRLIGTRKENIMDNITLARNGDKEAFSRLIQETKSKLYKTGMAILKNDDDVCDALQETLINAYKNIKNLKNPEYFNTWIIRIMINSCYDIIRKNERITKINEKIQPNTDNYYDIYCEQSDLEKVLNKLDNELRVVTVLYYYDDFKVKDISQILNIPEGTVKSRLARARKNLINIYKLNEDISS